MFSKPHQIYDLAMTIIIKPIHVYMMRMKYSISQGYMNTYFAMSHSTLVEEHISFLL